VRDVINVGDLETFGRVMGLCAGRTGQLLNLSALAADCGIAHTTARHWLSVLETSFIVFLPRPHHRNFSKRLIKSPKLYLQDTGLLCDLLRIRSPQDLTLHVSRGAVFEFWVVSEAMKNFIDRGLRPDLYFWLDSSGHEIDLLIEAGGGKLVPVEAKSGQTFNSDFVRELTWWRQAGGLETTGAVVYSGEQYMPSIKITGFLPGAVGGNGRRLGGLHQLPQRQAAELVVFDDYLHDARVQAGQGQSDTGKMVTSRRCLCSIGERK
jgi:hypothetical protein